MTKRTPAYPALPAQVLEILRRLGRNIAVARKRRRESLEAFAARLYVSRPTVKRLENGESGVSIGVLASALWVLGLHDDLAALAAPERDGIGQAITLRELPQKIRGRGKLQADDDF